MPEVPVCPGCGVRLPGDAPHGLCPKCLIRTALEGEPAGSDAGTSTGGPGGCPEPSTSDMPREFGDFRLIREIGRGGMGIVYEAVHRSPGLRVALKVLSSAAALDTRLLTRFQREVEAAQMLRHAHIVPVTEFGREGGVN